MDVYPGISQLPADFAGCVLSIGNFDGVHLGHQRILSVLAGLAAAKGLPAAVLTFDPHPAHLLHPASAPAWMMAPERRLELIAAAGVKVAVVIGGDRSFFSQTAGEFVRNVMVGRFRAAAVVEGPDFRFGMDRAGNLETLREMGPAADFEVHVVPPVPSPVGPAGSIRQVSSSLIRSLVIDGNVADAGRCLGRPFELQGPVIGGAARGRSLGFPTANLDTGGRLLPAPGVYAATAEVLNAAPAGPFKAAVSVGSPPTFPGEPAKVEAFLLDFAGDLYGAKVRLSLLDRLRGLVAFPGPDELKRQIAEDVRRVGEIVAAWRETHA